jgi:hypothetical protein
LDLVAPCTVANGDNPRTVSIPVGGKGVVTFAVNCESTDP